MSVDLLERIALDRRGDVLFALSLYLSAVVFGFGIAFPRLAATTVAMVVGVLAELLMAVIARVFGRLRAWFYAQGCVFVLLPFVPGRYATDFEFGALATFGAVVAVLGVLTLIAIVVLGCMGLEEGIDWLAERLGARRVSN